MSTPGDFGTAGERPSHPALLDWLVRRFIDHGYSLKWLHREIVMSTRIGRPAGRWPRPPTAAEFQACLDTLQDEDLETVCRAAFNANEFLFHP